MTKNVPIINTLLICNENTSIETIEAFLYRAMLCEEPVLFVISNMECLELSIVKELIVKLKDIYDFKKNKLIHISYSYMKKLIQVLLGI